MQPIQPTTPFGRRPASLGLIASGISAREALAAARAPGSNSGAAINKWNLFRAVTAARVPLGLSDRTLTLLNALLSFHPEVALTLPQQGRGVELEATDEDAAMTADPSCDLVVFPSNRALSARAHGMAEKTIRRHLALLVEAGLITRRDSPNGKRYARRAEAGAQGEGAGFADAYGFDITPLVLRASEIEALAETERRQGVAIRRLSERITILRRDVGKCLALALEEGLTGPFEDYQMLLVPLMTPLRRIGPDVARLEAIADALTTLRSAVTEALEAAYKNTKMTGNDGADDRHLSNSNPETLPDLEPSPPDIRGRDEAVLPGDGAGDIGAPAPEQKAGQSYPLGMVMNACPDVLLYAESGGVANWRDFRATMLTIRPMLGISPDAWRDAAEAMGETDALIAIATILQRSEHSSEAEYGANEGRAGAAAKVTVNGSPAIRSAGGYLRSLTIEARAGTFHLGPVLMALIGQRQKSRGMMRAADPDTAR